MTDIADLVSAGDAWDASQGGGSSLFSDMTFPSLDFGGGGSGAPFVAPTLNLPSTAGGMTDVFRNIAGLVNSAYQGEAMVEQAKFRNKIANAQLANQLQTVRTTPNIWLVLGIAGAGFFALELMDRKKR